MFNSDPDNLDLARVYTTFGDNAGKIDRAKKAYDVANTIAELNLKSQLDLLAAKNKPKGSIWSDVLGTTIDTLGDTFLENLDFSPTDKVDDIGMGFDPGNFINVDYGKWSSKLKPGLLNRYAGDIFDYSMPRI